MAALKSFSYFSKILKTTSGTQPQFKNYLVCCRYLNYQSIPYDNPDPAPTFLNKEVQQLLKSLTRIDLSKVYRKRKTGEKNLEIPTIKFMTDEELQEILEEKRKEADAFLQLPPILAIRKETKRVYSRDPALQGYNKYKYIFTDISFGVKDPDRLILERDLDGTLQEVDYDVRERINQIYFPKPHRNIKIPKMFTEDDLLENILNRGDYLFILDRACCQFEPNDPLYQKVCSITYQWINDKGDFEALRSTRHFGGLTFFLVWNKDIDNLLLDLINTGHIDEINDLISLYGKCHNINFESDGNLKSLEEYVSKYSNKKGALELAIQSYKDLSRRRQELEQGIKAAHGIS